MRKRAALQTAMLRTLSCISLVLLLVGVVGCGSGGANSSSGGSPPPPTGGALTITIMGLPSSVPANVSITGPNGYNTTITATSTVTQLSQGTYTIAGNAALSGSSNYFPSVTLQTVAVSNGATASAAVSYSVVAPTTTKVLDQAGSQTVVVSPDGSTLTISSSSAVAQSLTPGDILAIGVTSATPRGMLRQIESVIQNGSQIVATTTQGTLAETFQQANFTFQGALAPGSFGNAKVLRRGVKVLRGVRPKNTSLIRLNSNATSDPCTDNSATFVEMIDVPIVEDDSGSITASGEIEICPSLQFNWSISGLPPQLTSLTSTATTGASIHVNVTGRYNNSFNQSVPILTLDTDDPIVVFVGPIPIVLFPELTFFVGVSGDVTVGFSTGATQTATVTAGISYANGQLSPTFNTVSNFATDPLGMDGSFSAKGYAGVTIDLDIDGVLSPEFSPDAYLQLNSDIAQNPWWTLDAGLEGSGSVAVSIFGFADLADLEFPNLFNYSTTIAQASGGFLTADAAPTLMALTPSTDPSGSPTATLNLSGSNFVPGSVVNFNGSPLSTTFETPNSLTATLPSNDLTTGGSFQVTVTNPDTAGATSAPLAFTVSGSTSYTEKVLYSFAGGSNGADPFAGLVLDQAGNLYGTTVAGGGGNCTAYGAGCGTVFKLTPNSSGGWTQSVLYSFQGGSDGETPFASVILDNAANLYGTTFYGGNTTNCSNGCGTVFELSPTSSGGWTESVPYAFQGGITDGAMPIAGLTFDQAGNLYGTTGLEGNMGGGTVFELSPSSSGTWTESVLYNFQGNSDGSLPSARLIFDQTGNLYGTTQGACSACVGTAFKLTPSSGGSWAESVLHIFQGNGDGYAPHASLVFDQSGNLYGTTVYGGNSSCIGGGTLGVTQGCGTVFELSPASGGWTENVLYSFQGGADGAYPDAGLTFDQKGNLFSTTNSSNVNASGCDCGNVFELSPTSGGGWAQSVLYEFQGGTDGAYPTAGLIMDAGGNLYGTTTNGVSASSNGVVFELIP